MNTAERLYFAKELQKHHYFFRMFWDIGEPIVDDFKDLPTAAIEFDLKGNSVKFLINKTFWNSLDNNTKLFIICHEMFHILFEHGKRFVEYLGTKYVKQMNYAADVVINEMMCKHFGFFRNELDERISEKGCWLDTIFPDNDVPSEQSTEYYFNLLKHVETLPDDMFSFDEHRILSEDDAESITNLLVESGAISELKKSPGFSSLPSEVLETVAGCGEGNTITVDFKKVVKKKWESIIKKWEALEKKEEVKFDSRWERNDPRYSEILTSNTHLPYERRTIVKTKKKNKKDVFFFLDTSGSCISLANRFFKAAHSLDPKKFNVRLFCFDTRVKETSLDTRSVYGGGGTYFNIIESHIQGVVSSEKLSYPKAVFVITDGYGTSVSPQFPKRWYWFLAGSYTTKVFIPPDSQIFDLSNFE